MIQNQLAGRGGGTQYVDKVDILWEECEWPDQVNAEEHTEDAEEDNEEDSSAIDNDDDGGAAG